jgi:hypothetical protein
MKGFNMTIQDLYSYTQKYNATLNANFKYHICNSKEIIETKELKEFRGTQY